MKPTTAIHPNGKPYLWEVTNDVSGDSLTDDEIESIVGIFSRYWNTHHRPVLRQAIPGWLASIGAPEEDARTVMARLMALAR